MKKIIDWFDYLPEEVRMRAFCNTDLERLNKEVSTLNAAIAYMPNWMTLPEGYEYWEKICFRAQRGYYNNPITIQK